MVNIVLMVIILAHLFICVLAIHHLHVACLAVVLRQLDVLLVWEEATDSG